MATQISIPSFDIWHCAWSLPHSGTVHARDLLEFIHRIWETFHSVDLLKLHSHQQSIRTMNFHGDLHPPCPLMSYRRDKCHVVKTKDVLTHAQMTALYIFQSSEQVLCKSCLPCSCRHTLVNCLKPKPRRI